MLVIPQTLQVSFSQHKTNSKRPGIITSSDLFLPPKEGKNKTKQTWQSSYSLYMWLGMRTAETQLVSALKRIEHSWIINNLSEPLFSPLFESKKCTVLLGGRSDADACEVPGLVPP